MKTFVDLPAWEFEVREVSAGVYRMTGYSFLGHEVSATGVDPNILTERLRADASHINSQVPLLRDVVYRSVTHPLTKAEAEEMACNYLKSLEGFDAPEMVVLGAATLEREFGWVFFYQSKRYVETGHISYMLAGNVPLVVTKSDGRLHQTGTAYPIEHYLQRFVGYKPI